MSNSKNNLPVYKFSSFTEDMAVKAFGLKQQLEAEEYLTEWLQRSENVSIDEDEHKILVKLNRKLNLLVRTWNKQELREKFISPMVELVDFDLYDFEVLSFAERDMKVVYNQNILQGKVEWMVAKGWQIPLYPFFFMNVETLSEVPIGIRKYKRKQGNSNDPVGQLLVMLCVAQLLNNQKPEATLFNPNPTSFGHLPLYGIYTVGRFWFFVRLKDNRYYISKAYNSEEMEDLIFVLKMLKAQKEMILELVGELEE